MKFPEFSVKRKQSLLAGAAAIVGVGVVAILFWQLVDGQNVAVDKSKNFAETTNITSAGQRIDKQVVWVDRIESEAKITQKRLENLEQLLLENMQSAKQQQQLIAYLKQKLTATHGSGATGELPEEDYETGAPINFLPQVSDATTATEVGIKKIVLNLNNRSIANAKIKATVENTIPAGAYARAILLGGVDASTSVAASSDPRPVLLRLTDHGHLPRRFKSDLKACHVLASCYGDLSSERVYMRLEKLTCTEPLTGEIIETQVAGYVAGEDGRAGVRGVVVDRAGELVRNSFIGGFLGGVSNFFSAYAQRSLSPNVLKITANDTEANPNRLPLESMLGAGAAQGGINAMDKFADFYIKRAEQLQPVLQVAAGRQVDIIFTQGTQLGATSVQKTIHRLREQSRRDTVNDLEKRGDMKNWLPQNRQQ
ncbi:MAG: TraB/VirB10 family protein [Pseudomonadota bacterium]